MGMFDTVTIKSQTDLINGMLPANTEFQTKCFVLSLAKLCITPDLKLTCENQPSVCTHILSSDLPVWESLLAGTFSTKNDSGMHDPVSIYTDTDDGDWLDVSLCFEQGKIVMAHSYDTVWVDFNNPPNISPKYFADDYVSAATVLAAWAHKSQRRKYTDEPYAEHLKRVANAVALFYDDLPDSEKVLTKEETIVTAWLHDIVEDTDTPVSELFEIDEWVRPIACVVKYLTEVSIEGQNRQERKEAHFEKLSTAPGCIQLIKYADIIDNISTIVDHDPKFAKVYLAENEQCMDAMIKAPLSIRSVAHSALRSQKLKLEDVTSNV